MNKFIPVATPYMAENSGKYVQAALDEGAISGLFGENIGIFEKQFAEFVDVKYAVSCSSGTSALHLAMAAHGISKGDEVLVASLTNMATFFAVLYCGATPVPVDIDKDTFCISVDDLKRKVTSATKAILVVHLFGQACDMKSIMELSQVHGIKVFEDCAQSHGALYEQKMTGSIGEAGCFSFFANKNLNTGEGGMVTTDNFELADQMRAMRSLCFGKTDKFLHSGVGFNYRMDNLKASLGRAQMDDVNDLIDMKVNMGQNYDKLLSGESRVILPKIASSSKNVYWMYHVRLIEELAPRRDEILEKLKSVGVDTRPGFVSYTLQPFCDPEVAERFACPVSESVSYATFYLPSSHDMDISTQRYVVEKLTDVLDAVE